MNSIYKRSSSANQKLPPRWQLFGLYAWGFSLGLPDIYYRWQGIVNVRLDDVLICVLFGLSLFSRKRIGLTLYQRKYLNVFAPLLVYVFLSSLISFIFFDKIRLYPVLRAIGITVAFFTVYRYVNTLRTFRNLLLSLCIGGLLCIIMQMEKIDIVFSSDTQLASYQHIHAIKSMASPESWNANTLGTFCFMLTGLSFAAAKLYEDRRLYQQGVYILCAIFAFYSFIVFARAAAISVMIFFATILLTNILLTKRLKSIIIMVILGIIIVSVLTYYDSFLPEGYQKGINEIKPFEGRNFIERWSFWSFSFKSIWEHPLGIGFSNEYDFFLSHFGYGLSHNDYLSSFLELGLLGGFLYCLSLLLFPYFFLKIFKRFTDHYYMLVLMALFIGFAFLSFAMPSVYFSKPGSLSLAIAFAALGLEQKIKHGVLNEVACGG